MKIAVCFRDAVFYRVINVGVAAVLQISPYEAIRFQDSRASFRRFVKKERQNTVLSDVVGDVLFGIIRPHFGAVIDVFFKDVSDHVRVDVASVAVIGGIQVPLPFIEEGENILKRFVIDLDVIVFSFQFMDIEETAVQIRNFTEFHFKSVRAFLLRRSEVVMEQHQQELAVKAEKPVFSVHLLAFMELIGKIVDIPVQETFFLNEVTEHQAVHHQRCIPLLIRIRFVGNGVVDPGNKRHESGMIFFEGVVEFLGDLFRVLGEVLVDAFQHIDQRDVFLLINGEQQIFHFLVKQFRSLSLAIIRTADAARAVFFGDDILPFLFRMGIVNEDDDMFLIMSGKNVFDLTADLAGWDPSISPRSALNNHKTALLRYPGQRIGRFINRDGVQFVFEAIPAKFIEKR